MKTHNKFCHTRKFLETCPAIMERNSLYRKQNLGFHTPKTKFVFHFFALQ